MGKCKKVIKKTGKVVSAPVRVPIKKIKEKHQERKQKKAIKRAVEDSMDAIKDVFASKEFVEGMQDIANAAKDAFNAATGQPEVVVDAEA